MRAGVFIKVRHRDDDDPAVVEGSPAGGSPSFFSFRQASANKPSANLGICHISPPAPTGCSNVGWVTAEVEGRYCRLLHSNLSENNTTFKNPLPCWADGSVSMLKCIPALGTLRLFVFPSCWNPIRMVLPSGQAFPCQLLAHPLMKLSSLVDTPLGKVDFSPSRPPLWL